MSEPTVPGDILQHPDVIANEARLHVAQRNADVLRREQRRRTWRKLLIGGSLAAGLGLAAITFLPGILGVTATGALAAKGAAGAGILTISGIAETTAATTIASMMPAIISSGQAAFGVGATLAAIGAVGR